MLWKHYGEGHLAAVCQHKTLPKAHPTRLSREATQKPLSEMGGSNVCGHHHLHLPVLPNELFSMLELCLFLPALVQTPKSEVLAEFVDKED